MAFFNWDLLVFLSVMTVGHENIFLSFSVVGIWEDCGYMSSTGARSMSFLQLQSGIILPEVNTESRLLSSHSLSLLSACVHASEIIENMRGEGFLSASF